MRTYCLSRNIFNGFRTHAKTARLFRQEPSSVLYGFECYLIFPQMLSDRLVPLLF